MPAFTVDALVELLQLSPHPEGGYYRETFRSTEHVLRLGSPDAPARSAGTAIYFLLPPGTFSAWHRVQSDEAWHHYDGAPLDLHTIDPTGSHRLTRLGRDLAHGERPQHVVPAGWLQAARPTPPQHPDAPAYTFCGCTVSPGFDFADFDMPTRADLRAKFPQLAQILDELSRG